MTRKFFGLMMALILTLCLTAPAFAFETESYKVYDATNLLDQAVLQAAEDEILRLIDDYQVDFHVDVILDTEGYELYEYIDMFYEEYEYGDGDSRDGIALMIHVSEDADGLALVGGQLYCGGENEDFLWGYGEYIDLYLGRYMTDEAWSGDLASDNETFAAIMEEFLYSAEGYLMGILDELEPGAPVTGDGESGNEPEAVKPPAAYEPSAQPAEDVLDYIVDDAMILSDSEWYALETRAREISDKYSCGVYAITIDSYYGYGSDPEDACANIHRDYDLGYDADGEAIVLLLSMDGRDYCLRDFGDATGAAITSYGHETLKDAFLDNFGDDDWYGGFSDYLEQSAVVLEAARSGAPLEKPLSESAPMAYGIALVAGVITAFIVCGVFKAQMKTAVKATSAEEYVSPTGAEIHFRDDRYTHTTRSKRRIESDSGGSGSGNNSSSGKF